jgi:hypothetical protein
MLIEVGRKAHELAARHGWNAHKYAAKIAAEALAAGDGGARLLENGGTLSNAA